MGRQTAGLEEALGLLFGPVDKQKAERRAKYMERGRLTEQKLDEAIKNGKLTKTDKTAYALMFNSIKGDSFSTFIQDLSMLTRDTDSLDAARLMHAIILFLAGCATTLQRVDAAFGTQFINGCDADVVDEYSQSLKIAAKALKVVEDKHALAASLKEG